MNKTYSSLPAINPEQIAEKGEEVYRKIKARLEKKHRGEFAAIEVDTGDYFLGDDQIEAVEKAKKKFPNKIFYFVRIGFPTAYTHFYGSVL